MEMRKKVQVKICGTEYTLAGMETKQYLQKIALYIDKKMNEIMKINGRLSTTMAGVLTAANIADNYFKALESEAGFKEKLTKSSSQVTMLTEEINRLKLENTFLKDKVNSLEDELLLREFELEETQNYKPVQKAYKKVGSA